MFYDKFKQLCIQKGVSCNRAAAEIGLSNATPTSWKKRGLTPKGDTLTKIADYFGVTTDSLLSEENNAPLANAIFNASRVTSITPTENAAMEYMINDILTNKKAPTADSGERAGKLRSIARLEESSITEDEDEQLDELIAWFLKGRGKSQ